MATLRVIEAGLQTTVQDLGRPGLSHMGVAPSGAADAVSLRVGNRIVGNDDGAAGLEMTLVGGAFAFDANAVICLAGAAAGAAIVVDAQGGDRAPAMWTPFDVRAGDVLRVGALDGGARAYLCIGGGGVRTAPVLGSRATHVASGLGGHEGRALRPGDELEVGGDGPAAGEASLARETAQRAARLFDGALHRRTLRVTAGAHVELFGEGALARLERGVFVMSDRSDRMGLRLRARDPGMRMMVPRGSGERLLSEATTTGAIQAPPGGELIALLVDRPPTGGYAVVACVVAADLAALGQLRPRDEVRFEVVEPDAAVRLLRARERTMDAVLMQVARSSIDLGCDAGEATTPEGVAVEMTLLAIVSSVNIACGGHAGDEGTMRAIARAAKARGVAIGAHPSYPDRAGFGRASCVLEGAGLEECVRAQIAELARICEEEGARAMQVKPHGALYHAAGRDERVAEAVGRAARAAIGAEVVMIGAAGSRALGVWRAMGLRAVAEGFVDRAYEADGTLRARGLEGATIEDPARAAEQAVRLATGRGAVARDGREAALGRIESLCVHGDTAGAVELARAVVKALNDAGVTARALRSA